MLDEKVQKFIAVVKDNSDPDKEGKVQIFIKPFMSGWKTAHYPWARPENVFGGGGSSAYGESNIPEKDSLVWVRFENNSFKKHAFYEADVNLKNLHPSTLFDQNVKSVISSAAVYPNAKFKYYKNGICIGVDSSASNPEYWIYHPKGTYLFMDLTGKLTIDAADTVTVTQGGSEIKLANGDMTVIGNALFKGNVVVNGTIDGDKEITANSSTVKTTLSQHLHSGNLGNPTSPPTPGT